MDRTLFDYLTGAGEVAATLGTGAIAPLAGGVYGIYKGVTSPNYGTIEGGREADRAAMDLMSKMTYQPRGEVAQNLLGSLGQAMDAAKIPPVIPELMPVASLSMNTPASAAQFERAGMAVERAIEPAVMRTLDKGGANAQMLQDMVRGAQAPVIDHPFLKPSVAFSNNPLAGLKGADKSSMTRYLKKLNNPGFAAREVMRENGVSQMVKTADTTPTFISPEDLNKAGNPLAAVAGDTSRAGVSYSNVNGVPLAENVDMMGGFQYPIINSNQGKPSKWASLESAAGPKQNHFNKIAEETGLAPRGVFFGMNPSDSADFSTHVSEMVMRQLPILNPSAQAYAEANALVRQKFPKFLGFDHPDVMGQIMDKGAGGLRKRIAFAAKQKRIEELGFPNYDDIREAVNHPILRNAKVGDSGLATFLTSPESNLLPDADHNTYDRGIRGFDVKSLPVSLPAQNMFKSIWDTSKGMVNKFGQPLNDAERMGVIKMSHKYQMPDQKWLDQIMPVYQKELEKQSRAGGLLSQFP